MQYSKNRGVTFSFSSIFGSHMVLQQGTSIAVRGFALPGTEIRVTFGTNSASTISSGDGRWKAELPPMKADSVAKPLIATAGNERIVCEDVLVGEVWLCSGQSNMNTPLSECDPEGIEQSKANFSGIRFIRTESRMCGIPLETCADPWQAITPKSAGMLSCIGYYFAKKIHQSLSAPIGIIHSAWGSASAEAFISQEGIEKSPRLAHVRERRDKLLANCDAACQEYTARMNKWYQENASVLPDPEKYANGIDSNWQAKTVDPAGWAPCEKPFLKAGHIPSANDGIVWYRREFQIPCLPEPQEYVLDLGIIDGQASIYFDGELLGKSSDCDPIFWLKPATYRVPARLLTTGSHSIAVRALFQFCAGNPYPVTKPLGLYPLSNGGEFHSLEGGWTSRVACEMPRASTFPAPHEKQLITPRPWPWPEVPWDMRFPSRIFNGIIAPLTAFRFKACFGSGGVTPADTMNMSRSSPHSSRIGDISGAGNCFLARFRFAI